MPKPYSLDLRERVIKALSSNSQKKVAEMFSISIETVKRWIKVYKQTNSIEPKTPTATRPKKINYEKVKEYIEANPDKTLKEVGDKFNIHLTAVFYIYKRLGITYKKKTSNILKEMKNKGKSF